jgi:hypothetical protein
MNTGAKELSEAIARMQAEEAEAHAKRAELLTVAMQGISTALAEMVGLLEAATAKGEKDNASAEGMVGDIKSSLSIIGGALTELVGLAERQQPPDTKASAQAIVDAIMSLRLELPQVPVALEVKAGDNNVQVQVPPNPLALTVQAGENHNHIVMPEPKVVFQPAPPSSKTVNGRLIYDGDRVVGFSISKD